MILAWIIFVSLPFFSFGDDEYDYFLDPSSFTKNAEHYTDKEGNEYAFYYSRMSWQEAEVICSSQNGTLVELDQEEDGVFIAQALSESALGYDALWVGAQFKDGEWTWTKSKKKISTPPDAEVYPMTKYPYWVEEPAKTKSLNQSCLAVNRLDHDSFLLAPLPCSLARPFVCSLPPRLEVGEPIFVPPIIEGEFHRYVLYQAAVTWVEAEAFCLDKGYKLASMDFNSGPDSDFVLLSQRMMRSRPVIENVWIAGKFDQKEFKWMWVADNSPISTIAPGGKEDKKDPSNNDPPWFRGPNIFQQGCLLLDRHLCDKPVFVEAKCDRKRSFVCQENTDDDRLRDREFVNIDDGLFISKTPRPWKNAWSRCKECFKDGTMLSLEGRLKDDKILKQVANGMAHFDKEIRHIWLGGHLSVTGDRWNWVLKDGNYTDNPGQPITPDSFKDLAKNTKNIQVSADCLTKVVKHLKTSAFQCLNMDRENQRHVILYGLACNLPQNYICTSTDKKSSCDSTSKDDAKKGAQE